MIDSTHMIKFQEETDSTEYQSITLQQKLKKKRTKFDPKPVADVEGLVVKKKANPKKLDQNMVFNTPGLVLQSEYVSNIYLVWIFLRYATAVEKMFPNFAGWRLSVHKRKNISAKKTVVTYLPPINASVTSFTTIYQYLSYMQRLCVEANMPYVNVTLDCGAAINCFKLIWNYSTVFDNVIVHLGDFHFMKEIFTVLGTLVKGSGFEEVVFQSNLSTSGSLNGVLSGSHYNRCWKVHEHFAEALERLFYKRFLSEVTVPDVSGDHITNAFEGNNVPFREDAAICDTIHLYNDYKKKARDGILGKTPQFWIKYYLDVVQVLH